MKIALFIFEALIWLHVLASGLVCFAGSGGSGCHLCGFHICLVHLVVWWFRGSGDNWCGFIWFFKMLIFWHTAAVSELDILIFENAKKGCMCSINAENNSF